MNEFPNQTGYGITSAVRTRNKIVLRFCCENCAKWFMKDWINKEAKE